MKKKRLLTWIFVLILLAVSVSAQPPFIQAQATEDVGLEIKFPPIDVITQSEDYEFDFHVFNFTDGLAVTSDISCDLHVYDNIGNHIFEGFDETIAHGYDYEFLITADNFSRLGVYAYIAYCNNSEQGGFVSTNFQVTPNGLSPSLEQALFYIVIMFLAVVVLILFVFLAWSIDGERKFKVGTDILEVNINKYIKIFLWMMSYQLIILISYLALSISTNFLFLSVAGLVFNWLFIILLVGEIPIFFIVVYVSFMQIFFDLKIQEWAKRGLKPR